jgi:catechol 2,3-dioxygenase-like lactoylglutathione lyase family enzyme
LERGAGGSPALCAVEPATSFAAGRADPVAGAAPRGPASPAPFPPARGGWEDRAITIGALDILYLPSRDVATDLAFYRDVLGARVVSAIEAMGTRVAEVALGPPGPPAPRYVLAEHLAGEAPILLHRVDDLDAALAELGRRGLEFEHRLELPLGPCATFRAPGGQRLGLYELVRPGVDERFAGRSDFG